MHIKNQNLSLSSVRSYAGMIIVEANNKDPYVNTPVSTQPPYRAGKKYC